MAVDLFSSLSAISSGDFDWYSKLSVEDKKSASPFIFFRWMTGTRDESQLIRLNTFVNPYNFSLGAEKELQFKLLTAAATGTSKRYFWLKGPTVKKSVKLKLEVIRQFHDISAREASLYVSLVSSEDALQMAENLAWEPDEIKKLKAELDGSGSAEKHGSGKKKR